MQLTFLITSYKCDHFHYVILLNTILEYKLLILSKVFNAFHSALYYFPVLSSPTLVLCPSTTGNINHSCLLFLWQSLHFLRLCPCSYICFYLPDFSLFCLFILLKTSPVHVQSFQESLSLSTLTQCFLGSVQLKVIFFFCTLFQNLASKTHRVLTMQCHWLPWTVKIWIQAFSPLLSTHIR